jgi:acyl-CoA reductase-like NAD-dependent aldehyde dehydrogenase
MAVTVRTLENFVGGEWVASTGESARTVVSPVTGETLAEAPRAPRTSAARWRRRPGRHSQAVVLDVGGLD